MGITPKASKLRSNIAIALDAAMPYVIALLATAVFLGLALLSTFSIIAQIILTVAVVVLGVIRLSYSRL